jgi:hypothetical protein
MSKVIQKPAIVLLWFVLLVAAVISIRPAGPAVAQEGGITPTAEACGAPTLQGSIGNVNVRSGPGLDYNIIGTISDSEIRPIVGRAGFTQWWLVQFDNDITGWVANEAVNVQGDIAALPVVDVPALPDGTIPTPGPAWIPAVNSLCTTLQTAEATPSIDDTGEWAVPTNLSRSGATSDPRIIVDSNGLFHVIWKDDVDGFIYAQGNGVEWSQPVPLELPFGTRIYYPDLSETEETPYFIPTLAADLDGNIHAFWIDDENGLYYSSVDSAEFATFSSWRTRQNLGASALNLDVALDSSGVLHLAYLRPLETEDAPPGIYYRQSADNGGEWSAAASLYQSRYFHAITADETNINLVTTTSGETTRVIIAWDNRSLGQVFAARSPDGGLTWEQPMRIDGRELEDTTEAVNPGQIALGALEDEVVMVWQAGHDGEICAHYYISSSDGGQTWEPRQRIEKPRGCHRTNQFLATEDGYIVLLALVEEVVGIRGHLLAWDGQRWSDPQEQSVLTSFQNPETYQQIDFQCHQSNFISPVSLFVVGCDGNTGKDIWLTQRAIRNVDNWFAPPPLWQPPSLVGFQPGSISSLNLLSDADGLLHAIWTRENVAEIFYSIQNNIFWSEPVPVQRALEGNSGQASAALDNNGHLLVAWSGISSGQIYFSSAETGRALAPADWSPTQVVSEPGLAAQSPKIIVAPSGVIYIIYSVPLNEERGLYLVRSDNGGESWTPTIQVFDGVAAGWAIVGRPQLTQTADGTLHILLTHFQNPDEKHPLAIFYSRSEDLGESWSAPILMAEQPVTRGEVFGFGSQTLQRLWFDEGNSGFDVWSDLSIDGGRSWDSPSSATGFGQIDNPIVVTADPAGRLHVLGVNGNNLQHWMWENNRWNIEPEASLTTDAPGAIYNLGATIATNGNLAVVFAVDGDEGGLYYTGRPLELPAVLPTPVPEPVQTAEPTTPPATPTEEPPSPTPTATRPATPTPGTIPASPPDAQDNSILNIALSFLPALILVGVAFYFGLRSMRGSAR